MQVPNGAGLAFAHKYRKDKNVGISIYGDGAANQGQVAEVSSFRSPGESQMTKAKLSIFASSFLGASQMRYAQNQQGSSKGWHHLV